MAVLCETPFVVELFLEISPETWIFKSTTFPRSAMCIFNTAFCARYESESFFTINYINF